MLVSIYDELNEFIKQLEIITVYSENFSPNQQGLSEASDKVMQIKEELDTKYQREMLVLSGSKTYGLSVVELTCQSNSSKFIYSESFIEQCIKTENFRFSFGEVSESDLSQSLKSPFSRVYYDFNEDSTKRLCYLLNVSLPSLEELKEIIDNTDDAESVIARYCDSSIIQNENSFSDVFEIFDLFSSLEKDSEDYSLYLNLFNMLVCHMLKNYSDCFLSHCFAVDNEALHDLVIDLITDNETLIATCGPILLYIAAKEGKIGLLKCLIHDKKLDHMLVNIYGGNSLLHIASNYGYMNIVRWLVGSLKVGSEDISANSVLFNERGLTPLHLASGQGHLNVVRYLSNKNRDLLNSKDKNGKVALYYASAGGHLDIVKYLVQEGLDPSMEATPLDSALEVGALYNQVEIVNYLLSKGLLLAIQSGDLARVQSFIVEKGLNLSDLELESSNTLHNAIVNAAIVDGHLDIVRYLIEEVGCDPNIRENDGLNALHCAANRGHLNIVKYLIVEGGAILI